MQFGFMPGRGTTDAIFILRQLGRKNILLRTRNCYFAFVDLEKAFRSAYQGHLVGPCEKLGIEEWDCAIRAGYVQQHQKSRVRVNNTHSDEFGVKVGGSPGFRYLAPLLFVIVLKAFFSRVPHWDTLGAVVCRWDLVISGWNRRRAQKWSWINGKLKWRPKA